VNPVELWDVKPKSEDHPYVRELAALPKTALLVLVADDETGDDERQSRLQTVLKRWTDIVAEAGGHVAADQSSPEKVMAQVRTAAKAMGKHLTPSSASLLVEMTGGSATLALGELTKVVAYTGEREAIQDSDVRAVVVAEQDYNVYQLVDAIVAGDAGTALRQLRTLVTRKDKIEGQAFARIFPTIARQFRLIWQARLCLDADCRASNPSATVLAMLPSKPRIHEEREWQQKRAVQAARRLSLAQIRRVFSELTTADARIKGMEASYSTNEAVEEMVLRLATVCRSRG
jgi:DNA polymerase-3 subunit delta